MGTTDLKTEGHDKSMFTQSSEPEERRVRLDLIDPDKANRVIHEQDEEFKVLVDSVRVLKVLQPIHLIEQGDRFRLIDGERRWRASRVVGHEEIRALVWPESASERDVIIAGVAMNEHRVQHSCLHVARRVRELKNTTGMQAEQLARETGLPIERVWLYLGLFSGSDFLLEFLEQHVVPLRVAIEMVRYEKATNEAKARKLAKEYLETPMSHREVIRRRKKDSDESQTKEEPKGRVHGTRGGTALLLSIEREWRRDAAKMRTELATLLRPLGFDLVPVSASQKND